MYQHSIELQPNIADLWWTVDDDKHEITFELHINTTGWVGFGISPAGGMDGADIAIAWVDSSGKVTIQDRYAINTSKPMIDDTTQDWFALQGREQNGWTAIQFKRLLDTCDTRDYPIKSGTNKLIFAYGLTDPYPNQVDGDITYHQNRQGSRTIPLLSYYDPPAESKFTGLATLEWRLNNSLIPPSNTVYRCKIFKVPNDFTTKRHAIAYKMLIDSSNMDLIHHLLLYECDSTAVFDDANLPDDLCDGISRNVSLCSMNAGLSWVVGGDFLSEFPQEAGYPIGGDFPIKYYLLEMHYNNPNLVSGRRDSSGIQFYLSNERRQYDLGLLTFGTSTSPFALAIPPQVNKFIIDSYCVSNVTKNFPASGITVTAAFPHTYLQGISVWTKLIRNNTVVEYLFNADVFDYNYQFNNRLPKPIKIYPGDEVATRCVYRTTDKTAVTLGGQTLKDEICFNIFTYYPRLDDLSFCATINHPFAWQKMMNASIPPNVLILKQWLLNLTWTPQFATYWQNFYNDSPRLLFYGRSGKTQNLTLTTLPKYKDLQPTTCQKSIGHHEVVSVFLMFLSCLITIFYA